MQKDAGTEARAPGPGSLQTAAGRTRGDTYQVEFQLGHPISHRPTRGESTSARAASSVEP